MKAHSNHSVFFCFRACISDFPNKEMEDTRFIPKIKISLANLVLIAQGTEYFIESQHQIKQAGAKRVRILEDLTTDKFIECMYVTYVTVRNFLHFQFFSIYILPILMNSTPRGYSSPSNCRHVLFFEYSI